jgi:hypothetical protein
MTLPTQAEIDRRKAGVAALAEADAEAEAQRATLKANAKAKLMAGEPLTEDEADTIVL